MQKIEFKRRLKVVGFDLDEFKLEHGLSATTYRNWVEIPRWAVYWLYWHEESMKLGWVRDAMNRSIFE